MIIRVEGKNKVSAYLINADWPGRANNQLKDLSKITSFRMDGSFEIWIRAMNLLKI